jgi:hypothetical protein
MHTPPLSEVMNSINESNTKQCKHWWEFDEDELDDKDMEKDCKNLEEYQRHKVIFSLLHFQKRYDL